MAPASCPFHLLASQDYSAFTASVTKTPSAFLMASLQERIGFVWPFKKGSFARVKPLIVVLREETINQRKSDGSALVLELCVSVCLNPWTWN